MGKILGASYVEQQTYKAIIGKILGTSCVEQGSKVCGRGSLIELTTEHRMVE